MALEMSHSQNVVHRNMSDSHVFVVTDPTEGGPGVKMMLGNFGNSNIQEETSGTRATFTLSDAYYLSHENVERVKCKEQIVPGKQCDIFAAGVMFLEICSGARQGEEKD